MSETQLSDYFKIVPREVQTTDEFVMPFNSVNLLVKHRGDIIYSVDITVQEACDSLPDLAGDITDWCQSRAARLSLAAEFSDFQNRVWATLLSKVEAHRLTSYSELASIMGAPNSFRAVARVLATNNFALVLPCHLVNSKSGDLSGFKWGLDVKRQLQHSEVS